MTRFTPCSSTLVSKAVAGTTALGVAGSAAAVWSDNSGDASVAADWLEAALKYGPAPFEPAMYKQAQLYQKLLSDKVGELSLELKQEGAEVSLDGKVVLSQPVARQTAFAGSILGVEGDEVLFESEGGKHVRLPLRLIARARLDVEF